jgi:hypothetical protein
MRRMSFGKMAAAVACCGMIVPPTALAVEPAAVVAQAPSVVDVALRPGGILVGQVVDPQGAARAGKVVSIQYANYEVARTTTDANGVFAARGLRGGQYQILTEDGISVCRLWAPETAPPAARPAMLLVSGGDVVRGQWGWVPGTGAMHEWVGWVKAHPFITAGAVAAAIAIPVAVADDDDDPPGS